MILEKTEEAFNNISRTLAITRYDIAQRQSVNSLGLNIHGENYFRDIFNFIYTDIFLENANFESQNSECIDLIDSKNKLAYQITTTRTKEKIEKTLKALEKKKYKGYSIRIYYLLDKANPNKKTIQEFSNDYGISIGDYLFDYTDLINDINNLDSTKIIELNEKYFKIEGEKYTEEITLNLVCKHLVKNCSKIKPSYDDDLGTIDVKRKLEINSVNERVSFNLYNGLDYISLIENNEMKDVLPDLRLFIIEELYKDVLIKNLSSKVSKSKIIHRTVDELEELATLHKINFNKILGNLYDTLEAKIEINDYNSMSISWIIISFFFEICDIGIKE